MIIARLTSARPWQILVVYGVTIALFAGLYTLWPGNFYQPYIKFEPAAREQKSALENDLKRAISSEFEREPNLADEVSYELLTTVQIAGEQDSKLVGTAKIFVAYGGAENRAFFLKVPFLVSPSPAKAAVESPGFVLPPGETSSDPRMQGKLRSIYITADPNRPIEDESILPHSADDRKLVENVVGAALERVRLDEAEVARVHNVVCAEQGSTCSRWGDLGRMLYFSAVTITTVGYGDVVPLSGIARLLAAVEATFGIVLLALLVNSLYRANTTTGGDGGSGTVT